MDGVEPPGSVCGGRRGQRSGNPRPAGQARRPRPRLARPTDLAGARGPGAERLVPGLEHRRSRDAVLLAADARRPDGLPRRAAARVQAPLAVAVAVRYRHPDAAGGVAVRRGHGRRAAARPAATAAEPTPGRHLGGPLRRAGRGSLPLAPRLLRRLAPQHLPRQGRRLPLGERPPLPRLLRHRLPALSPALPRRPRRGGSAQLSGRAVRRGGRRRPGLSRGDRWRFPRVSFPGATLPLPLLVDGGRGEGSGGVGSFEDVAPVGGGGGAAGRGGAARRDGDLAATPLDQPAVQLRERPRHPPLHGASRQAGARSGGPRRPRPPSRRPAHRHRRAGRVVLLHRLVRHRPPRLDRPLRGAAPGDLPAAGPRAHRDRRLPQAAPGGGRPAVAGDDPSRPLASWARPSPTGPPGSAASTRPQRGRTKCSVRSASKSSPGRA